jgi:hypothetical protein
MQITQLFILFSALAIISCHHPQKKGGTVHRDGFDRQRDLLLVHYDCKTDVDDLQSLAAFRTLLSHPDYADLQYHAVAGAYGTQDGPYVPPNDLFQLAFADRWSDAHQDRAAAVAEVKTLALRHLDQGGQVWIADAGQSDFSAALLRAIREARPQLNANSHIHIVQHSEWNEKVTTPADLSYVRENAAYKKIPDGNGLDNGTPGFRTEAEVNWRKAVTDPQVIAVWELAIDLCTQYNGQEGRYLNKAIAAGGMDFSDFSEVCWIMGLQKLRDAEAFFAFYAK